MMLPTLTSQKGLTGKILINPYLCEKIGTYRYFVASANPDGYAFSRDHNRMWRKTRSDNGGILHCKGVDANRNWGFHWNEGGSSNDKCSDTYHGPSAFSEVENVAVSNFLLTVKDSLIFYNSIHSYSQLILLPWGFQQTPPDDYEEMLALALKGGDALTAVHGMTYEVFLDIGDIDLP